MTNYLQTHLNIQETTFLRSFLTVFFEPQTLFGRVTERSPGLFPGRSEVEQEKSVWGSKKLLKMIEKRWFPECWDEFTNNLSFMKIRVQINKFNDWGKPEKAWISTIISQIDGNTFVCHRSEALCNGHFFKKQVCGYSLAFKLSNSWQIICH